MELIAPLPGVETFCVVEDPPPGARAGLTVLVMHGGLGLDHGYLRPSLSFLSAVARVVYYDHRGNGRSRNSAGAGLSHAVLAADAEALAQHLGADELVVLGHSYGSFVALEYALQRPARLRGLILCNSTPALDYPEVLGALLAQRGTADQRAALLQLLQAPPASDAEFARLWRLALPLYFHQQRDSAGYDALAAQVRCRAAAFVEANRDNVPVYDVNARLGEVGVPTLVIAGEHDLFFPPAQGAARLIAGIPGAELALFAESGHHPFLEEPERFRSVVLDFLARLPPGGRAS